MEDIKNSFKIIFQSTLGIFLGKIQEQLTKINEKKINENNPIPFDFLIPKHLKKKINNFLKTTLNIIHKDDKEMSRIHNTYFRKSLTLENTFFNFLKLNEDSNTSLNITDRNNNKDNNQKKELESIKEINESNNKDAKDKKNKIFLRRKKMIGTIINKNTKQVFDEIIDKKIEKENLITKKNFETPSKITNNTEIIKDKIDEFDDININEFKLEDDTPINISINNITKTFNSSYYITTNSDSNQEKKLNLSDFD